MAFDKSKLSYFDRKKLQRNIKIGISILVSVVTLFPVYAVLINSLKTNGQIFSAPFAVPSPPNLDAYVGILTKNADFWIFFLNSTVVAALTIGIILITAFMASLALSRLRFPGHAKFYNYFVMGMLFPLTVAILPLYLQLRSLGMVGSLRGVILAQVAFGLPTSIFILTGFFREVPQEFQDATQVDGGGIGTFGFKILLPISTPVISTVTVINFIQSWNQFLLPLLVLDNRKTFTIPLGVMQYQGQFTSGWNFIMAFIIISMIPMLLFYILLQRYIVAGLTAGAVKG